MTSVSRSRAERVEGLVLVVILLVVGVAAGAASFTHVHDWTMANSPAGTPDWFGWANACISELVPVAALLTIRRRRREGKPFGYPMFLLVCAVALSLSAQLAVAKPGVSGWLLSAVPALAFLGLSKLVLTTKPTPPPAHTPAAAETPSAPATPPPVEQPTAPAPPAEQLTVPTVLEQPVPSARPEQHAADDRSRRWVQPTVVPVPASVFTRVNGSGVAR